MSSYEIGLVVHLVGVLLFFGGALVAGVVYETARRREQPSEVALLLAVARSGALIVLAGAVLLLGGGLWLAARIDQLGSGWLLASLCLFAASLVLGALGGQGPKRARKLATRLAAERAAPSAELRRLLDDPVSLVANYASSALVLVILVLMVWQPGR